jgi:uncharacterized protein (DUF849 family)
MRAVEACLNGSRRPGAHPALPLTAEDLAAAARAVVDAGAFAVHVHPRRADGAATLDPVPCGQAIAAIRLACPGLPVGLSTAAWIEPDPDRRLSRVLGVYHGQEETAWPVIEAVLARGRDVRVGLEDVLTLPDGRPARDNAALVSTAVALASR